MNKEQYLSKLNQLLNYKCSIDNAEIITEQVVNNAKYVLELLDIKYLKHIAPCTYSAILIEFIDKDKEIELEVFSDSYDLLVIPDINNSNTWSELEYVTVEQIAKLINDIFNEY